MSRCCSQATGSDGPRLTGCTGFGSGGVGDSLAPATSASSARCDAHVAALLVYVMSSGAEAPARFVRSSFAPQPPEQDGRASRFGHSPGGERGADHGAWTRLHRTQSEAPRAGATHDGRPALPRQTLRALTSATGYISLLLLAATLLVGPLLLIRGSRTPISSYLRRDLGLWCAAFAIAHVAVGFQIHGGGRVISYFFTDGSPNFTSFGWANWLGLVATLLVVGLVVISSDRALGRLGASRWKTSQRANYLLFAGVVAHAVLYGAWARSSLALTAVHAGIAVVVVAGQLTGIALRRRRLRRTSLRAVG